MKEFYTQFHTVLNLIFFIIVMFLLYQCYQYCNDLKERLNEKKIPYDQFNGQNDMDGKDSTIEVEMEETKEDYEEVGKREQDR